MNRAARALEHLQITAVMVLAVLLAGGVIHVTIAAIVFALRG